MDDQHKGCCDTAEADNHPGEAVRFYRWFFSEMIAKANRADYHKNEQGDQGNC